MKKILCAVLFTVSAVHTVPTATPDDLVELVRKFKACPPNQMRNFLNELSPYGITPQYFLYFVAAYKRELALEVCKKEFGLSDEQIQKSREPATTEHTARRPIIYTCPLPLECHLRTVREIVEDSPYHWPQNLTVHYGKRVDAQACTQRHPDGSPFYQLHLPLYFIRMSKEARMALLGHEHAHLMMHHNEKTAAIMQQLEKLIRQSNAKHQPPISSQFQNSLLKKISSSTALNKLCRAQEHQADFLSLLHTTDPQMIVHGMRKLLTGSLPDANHPQSKKRRRWTTKFANLLEAEKQLQQELTNTQPFRLSP